MPGIAPTFPEQKSNPLNLIAWENCGKGAGAAVVETCSTLRSVLADILNREMSWRRGKSNLVPEYLNMSNYIEKLVTADQSKLYLDTPHK